MNSEVMFYLLAEMILIFSVLTVTSRKILRAAVYLLFVLISTAADTIELAAKESIPLITSPFGTFELCGRLYRAGLSSFESVIPSENNG